MQARDEPFVVLHVCTANLCRSQLAVALMQRAAQQTPLLRRRFQVLGAGTHALDGMAVDALTSVTAAEMGLDLAAARSRRLRDEQVRSAALILTATREHRGIVLSEVPDALRRTFTLLELADLVRLPSVRSAASPAQLVASAAAHRGDCTLQDPDIHDPVGGSLDRHRAVALQIDTAVAVVFRALAAACRHGTEGDDAGDRSAIRR